MSISHEAFEYVRRLVQEGSSIVLEPGKEYLVEQRLTQLVRQVGAADVEGLYSKLRSQPRNGLHRQVVEAMTTNETSFFRDLHPFEALRQGVLPELLRLRRDERRLAIWSAACSSGQEAYSIAMLIHEHFPELLDWSLEIIGTDLSSPVVERAREGAYSQFEVNRGLPAPLLVKYFRREGTEWRVDERLRRMVQFKLLNLTRPWGALPRFDIVFMRNVLIYFDLEARRDVLTRTRAHLRPDGCLFLGGAETTLNVDDTFVRQRVGGTVCYRVRGDKAQWR